MRYLVAHRQGIIYPDCVGEAAPTLGGGKGREGGKRNAARRRRWVSASSMGGRSLQRSDCEIIMTG